MMERASSLSSGDESHAQATMNATARYMHLKAVLWLPVMEVVVCVLPYNGSTWACG